MIIIGGHLEFADGEDRDRVVAAAAPLQPHTLDEPGCAAYSFAADPCVDTRVQIYERWDDEASLAAHFQHPTYAAMREVLGQGTRAATDISKFRCDLREQVYDETFTPRADFFTADGPSAGPASLVIIAGHLDYADREHRDGAIAAGVHLQSATRAEEPGCLAYCFMPDPVDDARIGIFELWEDEASLAAHFEHPNYFNMRDVFGKFERTGGDTSKYRCDLREPVYDETRTARADFFTLTD